MYHIIKKIMSYTSTGASFNSSTSLTQLNQTHLSVTLCKRINCNRSSARFSQLQPSKKKQKMNIEPPSPKKNPTFHIPKKHPWTTTKTPPKIHHHRNLKVPPQWLIVPAIHPAPNLARIHLITQLFKELWIPLRFGPGHSIGGHRALRFASSSVENQQKWEKIIGKSKWRYTDTLSFNDKNSPNRLMQNAVRMILSEVYLFIGFSGWKENCERYSCFILLQLCFSMQFLSRPVCVRVLLLMEEILYQLIWRIWNGSFGARFFLELLQSQWR